MRIANADLHADAAEIRDEIPAPEDRDYTLMVRSDHLRVALDSSDLTRATDLFRALDDRGFRCVGGDHAMNLLIFQRGDGQ